MHVLSRLTPTPVPPPPPLGQRRGAPANLARLTLDLIRDRAEPERTYRSRDDYPSPPMSGSPPPPPNTNLEAGDRSQGSYQPASHDVYRHSSAPGQGDMRSQFQPPIRPHGSEATLHSFRRPGDVSPRSMTTGYPQQTIPQPLELQQAPQLQPHQHPYLPAPPQGPGSAPLGPPGGPSQSAFQVPSRPPVGENPGFTSPRAQRKTKGHVASACVPCKKAHLRCDSQRPCGRCVNNGRKDACIDVQHKKRGRPRLRDDKDSSRFDPQGPIGTTFDDPLRRPQPSYRVLKSQPTESVQPRFLERAPMSDANTFPAPLSITTRPAEPVAFLTMALVVTKASATFRDAIGVQAIEGVGLTDIVARNDQDKVRRRHQEMLEDQREREPQYLPPIFNKEQEERVIRSLAFNPEQISRFSLEKQDTLTFQATDGQQRTYSVRMGLAKQDSIYFIVLVLNTSTPVQQQPFPYPSPSPRSRDIPYSYQPAQHSFSHPSPASAPFESARRYPPEGVYGPGPSPSPRQPSHMMSGLSPVYAPSANRPEAPLSYQIPRSELTPTTRPPQSQPEFQLPPIRSQPQQSPAQAPPTPWPRDERPNRVDIGGLIEKPNPDPRQ
ncbi:uncharacterized protein MKZ38_007497 [Zalerion maritima]|uniref:Zn(2)-C6 fungal-type domain-containing protein n=1 Tax=Zalerion maritima TaxID=339359 RepID=A0AAD5RI06_9PEZI|nr:uncharacterized protein MKZ38_007497 [Zalerion maritima]